MPPTDPISLTYRIALGVLTPVVRWWGRLEVVGLENLPAEGPLLIAGNHDSYWDPVAIGIAAIKRRQIRALAKAELWKFPGLAPILNGMGQIPIHRGKGDVQALETAISELRRGACIGIFPEGTRSLGRTLPARSGIGRLAEAVPEARVCCVAVSGTVDVPRFPKRPRIRVEFFIPESGERVAGEKPSEFAQRLLDEIRSRVPPVPAGRSPKQRQRQAA